MEPGGLLADRRDLVLEAHAAVGLADARRRAWCAAGTVAWRRSRRSAPRRRSSATGGRGVLRLAPGAACGGARPAAAGGRRRRLRERRGRRQAERGGDGDELEQSLHLNPCGPRRTERHGFGRRCGESRRLIGRRPSLASSSSCSRLRPPRRPIRPAARIASGKTHDRRGDSGRIPRRRRAARRPFHPLLGPAQPALPAMRAGADGSGARRAAGRGAGRHAARASCAARSRSSSRRRWAG